uniref:Uncharacterized protein n=1 Tax=Caenorhabditis japonica TaxID=281687 RepID=A0A8R1HTJ8_CAEJA
MPIMAQIIWKLESCLPRFTNQVDLKPAHLLDLKNAAVIDLNSISARMKEAADRVMMEMTALGGQVDRRAASVNNLERAFDQLRQRIIVLEEEVVVISTGRPDYPVSADRVNLLRERLAREQVVMNLLTRPYSTAEAEQVYLSAEKKVSSLEELRKSEFEQLEARRMPGKPKNTDGSKAVVKKRGNVGNSLHTHQTVEDSLAELAARKRWD